MNFKECCDKATELIETCFDENNDDDLTFDERLEKIIKDRTIDDDIKDIIKNCIANPL